MKGDNRAGLALIARGVFSFKADERAAALW